MREEIAAAVVFLTRLAKKNENLSKEQISKFSASLSSLLVTKFKNHWYDEEPNKGQGYRCIRVNEHGLIDPLLEQAALDSGLQYADLKLPAELTLWVDPGEVTCRFGEAKGSNCVLATFTEKKTKNVAHSINLDELVTADRTSQQTTCVSPNNNRNNNNNITTKHINNNKTRQLNHNNYNTKNARNFHQRASRKFTANQSVHPGFMHPVPIPIPSDRYHWVRGADLVKV